MADEQFAGGTFGFDSGQQGGRGRFSRAVRAFTGSAQASLKFDIPGLQQFRREIRDIRTELDALGKQFVLLAKGPKLFSEELAKANAQMHLMRSGVGNTTFGQAPNQIPVPGVSAQPSSGSKMTAIMGAVNTASSGGGGTTMQIADVIGKLLSGVTQKIVDRFQTNMQTTGQFDVYGSRMALSSGVSSQQLMGRIGNQAPFFGSAQGIGQALYQQSTIGNILGAQGIAGQRGTSAAADIRSMQYLAPGLAPEQASQMLTGMQTNVQGINSARMLLGGAGNPYGAGGRRKSLPEMFKEVLTFIQNRRSGRKKGQPLSKVELNAVRIPGSNIYSYLAATGWSDDIVNMFFDWAEGQATYDPSGSRLFDPSDESITKARPGGESLATRMQQVQTTGTERDLAQGARTYDAYKDYQDVQERMIEALKGLDKTMQTVYNAAGKAGPIQKRIPGALGNAAIGAGIGALAGGPWGALAGAAIFGGASMLGVSLPGMGGDQGDPGDNGLSQMNPDVRGRIGKMMAVNPNLRINSGYRNSTQQKKLYESGNVRAARPGHSPHGRGQAADIGPASQYGWLARNARKFGLDTAGHLGEPWHVQTAGTISGLGDPSPQWQAQVAEARSISQAATYAGLMGMTGGSAGGGSVGTTGASAGSSATAAGQVGLDEVGKALYDAGFRGEDLVNMMAIPSRESGYRADATNISEKTKDESYGLWQINVRPDANLTTAEKILGSRDWTQLYDPRKSAQVAFEMYKRSGNTLRPWGGYKGMSNTYGVSDEAIQAARDEAKSLGYIGDPNGAPSGGSGGGNTTVSSTPVVFNNTFPISVTGGQSTDLDALARSLAPKIEAQFRRVTAGRR